MFAIQYFWALLFKHIYKKKRLYFRALTESFECCLLLCHFGTKDICKQFTGMCLKSVASIFVRHVFDFHLPYWSLSLNICIAHIHYSQISLCRWQSTSTGCTERLWISLFGNLQKLSKHLWATSSGWPCLGWGLDQVSLPTSISCDSVKVRFMKQILPGASDEHWLWLFHTAIVSFKWEVLSSTSKLCVSKILLFLWMTLATDLNSWIPHLPARRWHWQCVFMAVQGIFISPSLQLFLSFSGEQQTSQNLLSILCKTQAVFWTPRKQFCPA